MISQTRILHTRNLLQSVLSALLATFSIAIASTPAYTLVVKTDRPDAIYAPGETVTFEITTSPSPTAPQEISWLISKDGVAPFLRGKAPLIEGRASVTGTLDEPGFLQCKITYRDAIAQKTHTALAAAAIAPDKIQPSLPCPDDFDAFWKTQLDHLAAIPINPRLTPVTSPADLPGIESFDLQADCLGAPVSGYYSRPSQRQARTLPARLCVDGAGVRSTDLRASAYWATRGTLSLAINAHGIPNGQPGEYYLALEKGALKNYRTDGRSSRETSYFLGMFLRVVRALDFLAAQPEWDRKTLMIEGGSQGGAQAMAAAALDPRVSFYTALVTAMCDHSGMVAGRVAGWPKLVPLRNNQPDDAILQASRYFDMVNFAPRIKARGYFWVGFVDTTCPPTTVYAAYNQITAPKEIIHAVSNGHNINDLNPWQSIASALQNHMDQQSGDTGTTQK